MVAWQGLALSGRWAQAARCGVRVVTLPAREECPADPGVLVGDGDEALVIADALPQSHDPVFQLRALVGSSGQGGIERGARSLSQQAAQVGVAALGDLAKPLF